MATLKEIQEAIIAADNRIGTTIKFVNTESGGKLQKLLDEVETPTFGNILDIGDMYEQALGPHNLAELHAIYPTDKDYSNHLMQTGTSMIVYSKWLKNKVVYECDPVFIERLMKTENTTIRFDVFDRLPAYTFAVYSKYKNWSVRYISITTCITDEDMLVRSGTAKKPCMHIELCNTDTSNGFFEYSCRACNLYDNDNIDDRIEKVINLIYNNTVMSSFSEGELTDEKFEEIKQVYKDELKFAILISYYLAAQNAIVRHRQIKKTQRLKRQNGAPLNINYNQLGVYRGIDFKPYDIKRVNESVNISSDKSNNTGKEMPPHLRRAHWHHYWVGAKNDPNRHMILKWLDPIFVNQDKLYDDSNKPIVVRRV